MGGIRDDVRQHVCILIDTLGDGATRRLNICSSWQRKSSDLFCGYLRCGRPGHPSSPPGV